MIRKSFRLLLLFIAMLAATLSVSAQSYTACVPTTTTTTAILHLSKPGHCVLNVDLLFNANFDTIDALVATLPSTYQFNSLLGTGAPTATCSSTTNNSRFYTNTALTLYQCNPDTTGTWAWHQVGSTGSGTQGPQGPTGATGATGATGPQGPAGTTPTNIVNSINGHNGDFTLTGASCTGSGTTWTCALPSGGSGSVSVDGVTVPNPNFKSTGSTVPGSTQVAFAQDGAGNITGTVAAFSSSGAQYSSTFVDVFAGDSLGVVASPNQDNITAASCNGGTNSTSCQMTVTTPSFYHVGQWLQFVGNVTGSNNAGVTTAFPLWSPACLDFSHVQVTQITGSTVYFSEPQTLTPTRTGCTTAVSGTGGVIQDATYLFPFQVTVQPYLTAGGTVVPTVHNRMWPGQLLSEMDTNFAAKYGDQAPNLTGTAANFFLLSDDVCGTPITATFIQQMKDVLNQARADGFNTIMYTIPEYPSGNVCNGISATPSADAWEINRWIRSASCGITAFVKTDCADQVVDVWAFGINDPLNAYFVQQTGGWAGHLTNAGGTLFGAVVNMAMIAKNSYTTGGIAGMGYNRFVGFQQLNGGFGVDNFSISDDGGTAVLNGMGAFWGNYFTYMPGAGFGWALTSGANAAAYMGAVDVGMFHSTLPNTVAITNGPGFGGFGNLQFNSFFATMSTIPSTCSINGQWFFGIDGSAGRCVAGTVVSLSSPPVTIINYPIQAATTGYSGNSVTMTPAPVAGSPALSKNGLALYPGIDYTTAGAAITLTVPLVASDKIGGNWLSTTNATGGLSFASITIRGSYQTTDTASSRNLTLPAGSSVGDTAFIDAESRYFTNNLTAPVGWTTLQTGQNTLLSGQYKGALTSTDITNGYIAFSGGGTQNDITLVVFAGAHTLREGPVGLAWACNEAAGTTSASTDSAVTGTDTLLWISAEYNAGAITTSTSGATELQSYSGTPSGGVWTKPAVAGVNTVNAQFVNPSCGIGPEIFVFE